MRNGETTDCSDGHGWRDRKAERNADWDGQFKFLTVRNLISDCTGSSCENAEARNGDLRSADSTVPRTDRQECLDHPTVPIFKFLTVRNLISTWTGGGYGNGGVRNRVLSVGQLTKEEGRRKNAECECCARPSRAIRAANPGLGTARNKERAKPVRNDRRSSQFGQRRTCLSQIKPTGLSY
jgi:hypothetical protein